MPRQKGPVIRLTEEQRSQVEENMGIAGLAVRNYCRKIGISPRDADYHLLRSEAYMALCRAAQNYDPAEGVKFATYAYRSCWSSMAEERLDRGLIHTPKYLRNPKYIGHHHRKYWEAVHDRERHSGGDLTEVSSPPSRYPDPFGGVIDAEFREALGSLPERPDRVVGLRMMDGYSMPEIAAELGYTRRAIYKIRDRIGAKLRRFARD